MASSFTPNKRIEKPANGDDVDTWDVPVNADWDVIDAAFGATTMINVTSVSGTVVLTAAQYRPPFIAFSGTLTANVNYQLPSGVGGSWTITNAATGAFTITISSAGGGTTILAAQGSKTFAQSDGTNVTTGAAASGANSDITSLLGLTTPLPVSEGGIGVATITGLLKGAGTAAITAATAGTDYITPASPATYTATQTFAGSGTVLAEVLTNAAEVATISATAATGTIAFFLAAQSVIFFTSNAAANWTVNLTFSATPTALNSAMATGESITCAFLVTQGSPAFFNNAVQVDGTTSGVTTKWLGGAPSAGNVSGVDIYTYTILKTANATFSVFASQTGWR